MRPRLRMRAHQRMRGLGHRRHLLGRPRRDVGELAAGMVLVHHLQRIDAPPGLGRQVLIGGVHVGELRVAAARRHDHAVEHGERAGLAHEAVVGVPVGAVHDLAAVAQRVAVLARDDVDLGAFRRALELLAQHRRAELRHRVAKCRRRELLVADAQHQIVVQDARSAPPASPASGRLVEVDTAHRRGHVAAELLGPKTHGVAPGMRDNVRADSLNLKRGNP